MVRKIVIVGGGSAGWMTATYLKAAFGDRLEITLVESATVSSIGVGEATFSTLRYFFDYLGLPEERWMPACNGTYKLGIKFVDWRRRGHSFFHPFEHFPVYSGFTLGEWWLRSGPTPEFDRDCFIHATLAAAKRSPRHLDGSLLFTEELAAHLTDDAAETSGRRATLSEESSQYPYAYQFDASLLAQFLMRLAVEQGVRRVEDEVVSCELDERGWIDHLVTKEHGPLGADLFIDCSGFRGLLLNGTLGEPFISYQEMLPNDRAVALRVPVDCAREGIQPFTTATARDAGWIWTIPLYGRIGTGYVYSSDHCTPEAAEADLRRFVGPAADRLEANHIRMRVGRNRRSWVANCVAVGLSSGFVEPLESTGIFFIQHGIEQLVKCFPGAAGFDQVRIQHYNDRVGRAIDGICEFLSFHYYGAARADNDYWRATNERELPGELKERVRLWQTDLPDLENIYPYYHGFEPYSWTTLLMGLGNFPARQRPVVDMLDPAAAEREFARLKESAQRAVSVLPTQYEYFSAMRADR